MINGFRNSITYKLLQEKIKLGRLTNFERLKYISSHYHTKKIIQKGCNSNTIILLNNNIIIKSLRKNSHGYALWKNEVSNLLKLKDYVFFPDIIAVDPKNLLIYMTYCGKSLNNVNKIPSNWKSQFLKIKNILIKTQINPNDITLDNVCVLDGVLKLIDFGLANNNYKEITRSMNKLYRLLELKQIKN